MSGQILQNLIESINYFCGYFCILRVSEHCLINFTDNIIIKATIWENQLETKVKLCDFWYI